MRRPRYFDEGAIEAAHARRSKESKGERAQMTSRGAQARVNHRVMRHFARAIAHEANIGSAGIHVHDAVGAVLANIAISYVWSVTPDDAPLALQADVLNNLMATMGACLGQGLADRSKGDVFEPVVGGTA